MTLTPDIPGTEAPALAPSSAPSSAVGEFAIGESAIGGSLAPGGTPGLPAIIPSYLYWQYSDDEDLQALVVAWNQVAQGYLDWFNRIGLPVYTGSLIFGALLDWIAQGLYGLVRPTLPSGTTQVAGPFGTILFGGNVPYGSLQIIGPTNYYVTDDDIFKRIITWHFFKGDGKVFSIQWLKRRIMRFLAGINGASPNIDQTYRISVTFSDDKQVNITIVNMISTFARGALFGLMGFGGSGPLSSLTASTMTLAPIPYAQQLKDAIDFGALELPFQYNYVVTI